MGKVLLIARLIAQLSSDEFQVREQASRQLAELEEALPALRRAAKSDDAEVRRAAEELVSRLETRLEERFIQEAVGRVNEEGLDVFIDRMVLQKDFATEARWKAVVERDAAFDGTFVYSVRTTGVYCRPSCPSRLAKPENVAFHATCEAAERAAEMMRQYAGATIARGLVDEYPAPLPPQLGPAPGDCNLCSGEVARHAAAGHVPSARARRSTVPLPRHSTGDLRAQARARSGSAPVRWFPPAAHRG